MEFVEFERQHGVSLAEMNPGSAEFGLRPEVALQGLDILRQQSLPVLGGDILTCEEGKLLYAYQSWGPAYHALSWYCDRLPEETPFEYCERSFRLAEEKIQDANTIASSFGRDCFVVLVV